MSLGPRDHVHSLAPSYDPARAHEGDPNLQPRGTFDDVVSSSKVRAARAALAVYCPRSPARPFSLKQTFPTLAAPHAAHTVRFTSMDHAGGVAGWASESISKPTLEK